MKLMHIMMTIAVFSAASNVWAFDHSHAKWNTLVKKHVRWINNGTASQVNYAGFQKEQTKLKKYLNDLSGISQKEFDAWNKNQQLAFLINAYNAFTVELILTKYPKIKSIKDLGSFLKSPWKKSFFTLLGKTRHLDEIEHDMIRKPGKYDDSRIHAAVNCASVGCPALRDEAFTAKKLNAQLEDNMERFLKDSTRNRYNPKSGKLEVSKIFDWYGSDFKKGFGSLNNFFAKYAKFLADSSADQKKIKSGKVKIIFLDYDWNLNNLS